jgi:hypothetical protein
LDSSAGFDGSISILALQFQVPAAPFAMSRSSWGGLGASIFGASFFASGAFLASAGAFASFVSGAFFASGVLVSAAAVVNASALARIIIWVFIGPLLSVQRATPADHGTSIPDLHARRNASPCA